MTHLYPIQRVTLITLGVHDLARSRAFYKALGWHPHSETDTISFYQLQGAALGLYPLANLADDMDRPATGLGTGAMTVGQNFATEEAVDAAWHTALQAGASNRRMVAIRAISPTPTGMSGNWPSTRSGLSPRTAR